MRLAYDLKIPIYFQDTDSMHIDKDSLIKQSDSLRELYKRELIGLDMGQFHSNSDPLTKTGGIPYATESYFIGKKLYIDKLTDNTGSTGHHIRGKV